MSCIRFQVDQRKLRLLMNLLPLVLAHALMGQTVDNVVGIASRLNWPSAVALDAKGAVIFVERLNYRVRRVEPDGTLSTLAGIDCVPEMYGPVCFSGDGGPARLAAISDAFGLASDSVGNLFLADSGNARIRRIDSTGIITTITGNGQTGYSGDNGAAVNASLSDPRGVAVDGAGNLYIADSGNQRIRKVTPTGVISTVAGTGVAGFSNDGGPATSAELNFPNGLCLDSSGNLYFADRGNNRIRKISPSGIITTYAGNGTPRSAGDGLRATDASLNDPSAVAIDGGGGIYIAETASSALNGRIRRVGSDGIITSVEVHVNNPRSLAVDGSGNLLIADSYLSSITMVSFDTLVIAAAVNAAGAQPEIASSAWFSIYGTDLSATTRLWTGADFNGNQLPLSLDGVRVTVNGKSAPVCFISPGQVNALAPDDNAVGDVSLGVSTAQGTGRSTLRKVAFAPALFLYGGTQIAIVQSADNYSQLGPPDLLGGIVAPAARPGETVVLWGTGFGPTNPPTPALLLSPPAPLANRVDVTIGGVLAHVDYAGLVGPGLYQLNVVIPQGLNGTVPISAMVGGATSPAAVTITVRP